MNEGGARPGPAPRPLAELFPGLRLPPEAAELAVSGIALDSRKVRPGELFAAMPGSKADGLAFVAQAIENGAVAVLAERTPDQPLPIPLLRIDNVRAAVAKAAARFYAPMPEVLVAVTGTAGKTSVAHFTRQIWTQLGVSAAYLGTLGVEGPSGSRYGSLTTPDPVELAATLGALAGAGVTHAAIEASSHGLDQHRLDGLRFAAAAFTNIGRDHLDYHPSFEAYLDAKLRLFRELLPDDATAVFAQGAPGSEAALAAASIRGLAVLTVGTGDADIAVVDCRQDGLTQRVTIEWNGESRKFRIPLVGGFQVSNALVAAGLCIASGCGVWASLAATENLKGVPGRLEMVGTTEEGAPVFVDYAHKPDALGHALEALRPFASGRLIVVFGAGGDRDPGKRSLMGAIAAEKADIVVVTDDNPRSEDPAAIRAAILAAAPEATEIGDRGEAIRRAVAMLAPGDVLLVAGKGHETGQIVGDRTLPFADQEVVREALRGT